MDICIREIATDLCELASVEKLVLPGEQEGCGDKVLDGSDYWFSIPRSDEVMFDAHEFQSFGSSLLRLWDIWNII